MSEDRSGVDLRASILVRLPVMPKEIGTIVQAHRNVIAQHGSVWFAIVGKKLSSKSRDQLRSPRACLYVVQKNESAFVAYKGRIIEFAQRLSPTDRVYIPPYYFSDGIFQRAGAWVRLSSFERTSASELESLKVVSTHGDVLAALRGMSPYMIVEREA